MYAHTLLKFLQNLSLSTSFAMEMNFTSHGLKQSSPISTFSDLTSCELKIPVFKA